MILVDTSVWIDHLHRTETMLADLLEEAQVCTHPMVIEELALGTLRQREDVLNSLASLPWAPAATHEELLAFVGGHHLDGLELNLVDAHLLAAARLGDHTQIWTRDRRLRDAATRLDVATAVS